MPQAERLFHICRRLNEGARVSVPRLMDELEVSRATIFRDMELLRDRLHAPLVWDADDGTYRLESGSGVGARFILPGMWMEARQLYGMLTVINLAAAIDPGVAGRYRREYGALLKRALAQHDIRAYGLDRKISVELEAPPEAAQAAMAVIGPALMLDAPIRLWAQGLADEGMTVLPTGLRLRADGWWLEYRADVDSPGAVPLRDVRAAEAIGNLGDLPEA